MNDVATCESCSRFRPEGEDMGYCPRLGMSLSRRFYCGFHRVDRIPEGVEFLNMTSHPITLLREDGSEVLSLSPSGTELRTECRREEGEYPFQRVHFRVPVRFLPPVVSGRFYVVSTYVKLAHPERGDFCIPLRTRRDETGQVVGCLGFGV